MNVDMDLMFSSALVFFNGALHKCCLYKDGQATKLKVYTEVGHRFYFVLYAPLYHTAADYAAKRPALFLFHLHPSIQEGYEQLFEVEMLLFGTSIPAQCTQLEFRWDSESALRAFPSDCVVNVPVDGLDVPMRGHAWHSVFSGTTYALEIGGTCGLRGAAGNKLTFQSSLTWRVTYTKPINFDCLRNILVQWFYVMGYAFTEVGWPNTVLVGDVPLFEAALTKEDSNFGQKLSLLTSPVTPAVPIVEQRLRSIAHCFDLDPEMTCYFLHPYILLIGDLAYSLQLKEICAMVERFAGTRACAITKPWGEWASRVFAEFSLDLSGELLHNIYLGRNTHTHSTISSLPSTVRELSRPEIEAGIPGVLSALDNLLFQALRDGKVDVTLLRP